MPHARRLASLSWLHSSEVSIVVGARAVDVVGTCICLAPLFRNHSKKHWIGPPPLYLMVEYRSNAARSRTHCMSGRRPVTVATGSASSYPTTTVVSCIAPDSHSRAHFITVSTLSRARRAPPNQEVRSPDPGPVDATVVPGREPPKGSYRTRVERETPASHE
jgi:hypothetical protein